MSDKYIHLNIKVSGSVQGVGFRYAALRAAGRRGIKGYIRNLPDGSVFIEAEGKRSELNDFVSWCHEGPIHARVERVEVIEGGWEGLSGFDIRT